MRNDPVVTIMENIELHPSGCWLWTGSLTRDGYPAQVRSPYGRINAHRVSYATFVGPLDPSLVLDHVLAWGCTHRHCVNPSHLEQVTVRENTLRSPTAPTAVNARKSECPRGHPLPAPTKGVRACKVCAKKRNAAWDEAHRIERRDATRRRRALVREA